MSERDRQHSDAPTAARVLVDRLAAHGIDKIFVLPGEENLSVMDALRESPIDIVIVRHEQHGAFMAATTGRLTGLPGVCLATLGPGALNTFTGVAHAQLGGFPLIAITGQKPARDNDEGSFQVVDIVAAAAPITKWATSITDARNTASVVDRAFRESQAGRPGAVLLELPEDVAATSTGRTSPPVPSKESHSPTPAPTALREAARRIDDAHRVVLLASEAANTSSMSRSLAELAERTGIGVLTTQVGKGAIDDRNPLALGTLGIHRPDYAHHAIFPADVVVTVGYQSVEHPPLSWNPDEDTDIIHIAPWPSRPERGYQPVVDIEGAIDEALDALAEMITRREPARTEAMASIIRELLESENGKSSGDKPSPLEIVRTVRDALDPDDTVALDNGAYKIWFARHYRTFGPQKLLLDNALATMGAGLAVGTAAAMQSGSGRVVAVCGDGGFLMNVQDLETTVRYGVPLTVLVLRDEAYGFIEWHQEEADLVPFGVELTNPDVVALANAFGAEGVSVSSADELKDALSMKEESAGVRVISCPIDYSINDILESGLYENSASAFDGIA